MLFVCADAVPMSKSNIYFREYYNITQVRYITSLALNQVCACFSIIILCVLLPLASRQNPSINH